jgi:hypothetical protein
MGLNWQKPGIGHVGEFQAAGHTLVITGSASVIKLRYVGSSITVSNKSNPADDDANNKALTIYDGQHIGTAFTLRPGATARYKGKFLTFNVPAGMDGIVEMTNIPSSSYDPPSKPQLHYTD